MTAPSKSAETRRVLAAKPANTSWWSWGFLFPQVTVGERGPWLTGLLHEPRLLVHTDTSIVSGQVVVRVVASRRQTASAH